MSRSDRDISKKTEEFLEKIKKEGFHSKILSKEENATLEKELLRLYEEYQKRKKNDY